MKSPVPAVYFLFFPFLTLPGPIKAQPGLGGLFYLTDKESKIVYAIDYTPQGIQVKIKIGDSLQQLKLVHNGLEIWVDAKAGKSKKTGIKYPLPSADANMPGQNQIQQTGPQDTTAPSVHRLIEMHLKSKQDMELIGFKTGVNGKQTLDYQSGIVITITFGEKDTLEYSIYIPLSVFPKPLDPSKPLSVGIILKGRQQPDLGMNFGGPPGEGSYVGPPPGNGFDPPPGGQNGPDERSRMQKMFADNAIWTKVTARQ